MPWKEVYIMDERVKFIGRLLSGEKMSGLCREFGISRVTGYKIWERYQKYGSQCIYDRSRAPHKHPNQTPYEIENLIVRLKQERPNWGAPKIREIIGHKYPTIKLPATSTVHSILDRHELVKKRKHRTRFAVTARYLSEPKGPNDLWCTDFKGQFRLGNKHYCYPLTLTDQFSRYLISCEALTSTAEKPCFAVYKEAFAEYGLPVAIRSDNGIPFACGNSLWNMTKLSVWWIRLGIKLERITPGNPQQNGRHERMHRTLKQETANPAKDNLLQQQESFEKFRYQYNKERPHQALAMKCPNEVYKPSIREYKGAQDITYPDSDRSLLISSCGKICIRKLKISLSRAFANQPIGIKEVDNGIWQVEFMHYRLGYFDEVSRKFSPNDDPFGLNLELI